MRTDITVEIARGKLQVSASARSMVDAALQSWPDGPATLTIEREAATRSAQANAYYWAVVIKAIADHTGYTPDEVHEILKVKFLPKDVALAAGNGVVVAEFVIGGSTTKLTGEQFYDYIERIRQWAFEALDVDVPPADPLWRMQEETNHEGSADRHHDCARPVRVDGGPAD